MMPHPWQWLLITNLKDLVEEEVETTIKEVMEDMEVEAISLVVIIPIQMATSTTISFSLNLVNQDLQVFRVKLNDHNVRSMERLDIWL